MEKKTFAKQALFFTLINYIGAAIGIISALFIYPLDFEFLGTIRFIDNISQLLFPIMVFGGSHALIKFYPSLDEYKQKQLFDYSLYSIILISVIVFIGVVAFDYFSDFENIKFVYFAFTLAIALAFIELFRKQAQHLQNIALPSLYEKIIPKIILPILFLIQFYQLIHENYTFTLYVMSYVIVFVLIAIYVTKKFTPKLKYKFDGLFNHISKKDYYRFSFYTFVGSFGSLLAFRVDGIIIHEWISSRANGVFGNGIALASTLQIPAVGIFALYAPVISNLIKVGNYKELQSKYKEVAKLLFFIGALLYSCILLGIDNLFSMLLTHDKLKETIPIIYISGFSVLLNMATGFNSEIITYSKYYRFNLYVICLLIILNVSLNFFVIFYTDLGIIGIAFASLLSMAFFNLIKLIYVYQKFHMLPFDFSFFLLLLIFLSSNLIIYFLPVTHVPGIDLIYKVGLSILVNFTLIYKLRLVNQVNLVVDKALNKLNLKK